MQFEFTVEGLPKPAGSKRGFALRKGGVLTGRVAITDACKGSAQWKADVKETARRARGIDIPAELLTGPLEVRFTFTMPRPAGHSGTKGLKASSPRYPITRPDLLKLARAVEDALTGIVWHDDAQIVREVLHKQYDDHAPVGVHVFVSDRD